MLSITPTRALVLTLVALAVLMPAEASSQTWPAPPAKAVRPERPVRPVPGPLARPTAQGRAPLVPMIVPGLALAAGAVVEEAEPNDSASLATPVSLGDTVYGTINPAGDYDFFAVDLEAGTVLDLDVDAQVLGSPLDSYLVLFNQDTSWVAYNDDADGLDSRLISVIPTGGRWFVLVVDYWLGGGSAYTYRLRFGELAVDETEPNATPATATVVALGDTVVAALTAGDLDLFAADVPAGTYVAFGCVPINRWVTVEMTLYDTDGATPLATDTVGSNADEALRHWISRAGRYYLGVRPVWETGILYGLNAYAVPIGPGDPTTVRTDALGWAGWAVAGIAGPVYVWDYQFNRLLRVTPDGSVSVLASNLTVGVTTLAVDGFGDLLVGTPGAIRRYRDDGTESLFADGTGYVYAMAVGPDGDVWALTCGSACPGLQRFDASGRWKSTAAVGLYGYAMAFAPSGQLHILDGSLVYALTPGQPAEIVIEGSSYFVGLAFDRDGYLYLGTGQGAIHLFDPQHVPVAAPLAVTNLGLPIVLFARDTAGAMTSRLLAVNAGYDAMPFSGTMVEVNPAGVRAPGHPPQPRLLRVAGTLRSGLVGAPYADTLRVLDAVGPLTWRVTEGALPPGLTLEPTGAVTGIPTERGTFRFMARVEAGERFGQASYSIQVGEPQLVVADVVSAVLGVPDLLTPDQERFLDLQGNNNGHLDIGDVRAFLRARGRLPAAVAAPLVGRREEP